MWPKILLFFFVFSFLFRTDHSFDQDMGRHLKIGEIIWQTKSVPLTNLFSYTYPDFPFINSHWFFEFLVYVQSQLLGLWSLLLLKLVVILGAVYLTLSIISKKGYLLFPIGFIFLHTIRERPELRPEIFSFLFTALTLYILEWFLSHQFSSGRWIFKKFKPIYLLPLIQLIWVNTHIYFIIGLVLQAIFIVHIAYQYLRFHLEGVKLKILGIVFGLSVIASLINPSGIKGFLNPLTFNQNYGYTIVENQTMFLLESINFRNPNFLFVKISGTIVILSLAVALFKKRFSVKNFGLAGAGLALALLNVRSFPYLAFISLPAIVENFGPVKPVIRNILFTITIPLLLYESLAYLNGDYYKNTDNDSTPKLEFKESGKSAMDFVLANKLPQPIFNNFDIGSYITYRGWPEYKIFVDGRPGEYPKEFFQAVYIPAQADPEKFKELDQKEGFKTIIFSHTDQTPWGKTFLTSIVKNPGWKTVYIDDFMIVLVKNEALALHSVPLEPINLSGLNPSKYSFSSHVSNLRLSLFLMQIDNQAAAESFARAGIAIFPESPLANAMFGKKVDKKIFW